MIEEQDNNTYILDYIDTEEYGKIAHFFSINEGNYYCRAVIVEDKTFFERLSVDEENELLEKITEETTYYEN